MFSMQEGDPRIPVIEQFLASGDEVLGVENWNPIGAMDYANPQSTVRRGAKEAATAAGIRMDNRTDNRNTRARQEMRDVLIENARTKEAAARRIAQIAVESMGLDGQAADAMAADVVRAFYNDLAQQSARRVAQMFGTDRTQSQRVQETMTDRLAELYNMGAFSNEQYRQAAFDSIFGENSGITISDNLLETFVNAAGERRDQAADEIYKSVASQIGSTMEEKWDAWRNLAMLGNPKTFGRNAIGSAAFQPYVRVKQLFGAGLERIFVDQENRTKAVLGAGENDRALMKWAFADSGSKATKALMDYSGTTGDNARSAIQDYRKILPGVMDKASKGVMGAMEATDMVFKRSEYAMSMASFLKARGYTAQQVQNGSVPAGVMEEGRQYAVREAMRATFNDRNRFSNTIANLRAKGNNPAAKAVNMLAKGVLPFTRTPANVLVRAVEYSPVGIAKSLDTIFMKARNGEATVAEGIDQLAAGLTGSGAYLLGAALSAGLIPGWRMVGKLDEEEKEAGAREYSIQNTKTGEYYDISWLAPGNMPLFIGANIRHAFDMHEARGQMMDGWDIASRMVENLSDIIDPLLELSMMSSLADALESASYQEDTGDKIMSFVINSATNYFTQGLPTILGQLEQMTEDTKTVTYSNADNMLEKTFQRVAGNASQRIPGIDLYQKEKVDVEGNVVRNEGNWLERGFNALLNPSNKYTEASGPVWDEKERLNKSQPTNVSSPDIPKKISYTDEDGTAHKDHLLTAEEYSTMEKVQRQTETRVLETVVESPTYQAMTDAQKAKVFTYAQDYAREVARNQALPGYAEPSGWMAGIENNEADAILRKVAQSSITDAVSGYAAGKDGMVEALEQAKQVYDTLPEDVRKDMMLNAGGMTSDYLTASNAGIDTETFLPLYKRYKEIDDMDGTATDKAQAWALELENARKAGDITKAQRKVLLENMEYMQIFAQEAETFEKLLNAGISSKNADWIATAVRDLKPVNGKKSVTDWQEAQVIAGAKNIPEKQKVAAVKSYVSDAQDKNIDDVLARGYDIGDYAKLLELYSSDSGSGKKRRVIAAIQEEYPGMSYSEAYALYKIFA
jgi:hypothetical protein